MSVTEFMNLSESMSLTPSMRVTGSTSAATRPPHVCIVGMNNLQVLAPEYSNGFIGGAELQQKLLAKALTARGFKVTMVVGDHGQPDGAAWDGIETRKAYSADEGIPVIRFIHPRMTRIWTAMRRADADIYYSCCADPVVFMVGAFARRNKRKAVFWVASDADCDPRRTFFRLRGKKGQWLRLLRLNWLYRMGLRRTDLVMAQSVAQQQMMWENYGKRSVVVPSLVDVNPVRRPFESRDIAVLWAATMRRLKRPELLIELAERLPDIGFTLAGGAAPEDKSYFEQTVRTRAAGMPNVNVLGFVPLNQIDSYFQRARVLVNTSAIEGLPNTYLQAWAEGAPVIAFHDPDNIIRDNGLGIAVKSIEDMQRAVETLTTDANKWREMSERCKQYFDRNYGPEQTIGIVAKALQDCR